MRPSNKNETNHHSSSLGPLIVDENFHITNVNCLRRRWRGFRMFVKRPSTYPFVLFATVLLFLNADFNLIAPNLTQIAHEFNLTDTERDTILGGQLSLGFFLIGGITTLFVGYYADKVNRVKFFVLLVMAGEFACFCTIFVTNVTGLFITRSITGISVGGVSGF